MLCCWQEEGGGGGAAGGEEQEEAARRQQQQPQQQPPSSYVRLLLFFWRASLEIASLGNWDHQQSCSFGNLDQQAADKPSCCSIVSSVQLNLNSTIEFEFNSIVELSKLELHLSRK